MELVVTKECLEARRGVQPKSVPVLTAQLTLKEGDSAIFHSVIKLEDELDEAISIGRADDCVIKWCYPQFSRLHAWLEVEMRGGRHAWLIQDCSTNGISVNGFRLTKNEAFPLRDGDIIDFLPPTAAYPVNYEFRYITPKASNTNSALPPSRVLTPPPASQEMTQGGAKEILVSSSNQSTYPTRTLTETVKLNAPKPSCFTGAPAAGIRTASTSTSVGQDSDKIPCIASMEDRKPGDDQDVVVEENKEQVEQKFVPPAAITQLKRSHEGQCMEFLEDQSREDNFTDMDLICDDGHVQVHRCLIMGASTFLRDLLIDRDIRDTTAITLPETSVRHLAQALGFLYSGKTIIDESDELEVSKIMERLGLPVYELMFRNASNEDQQKIPALKHISNENVDDGESEATAVENGMTPITGNEGDDVENDEPLPVGVDNDQQLELIQDPLHQNVERPNKDQQLKQSAAEVNGSSHARNNFFETFKEIIKESKEKVEMGMAAMDNATSADSNNVSQRLLRKRKPLNRNLKCNPMCKEKTSELKTSSCTARNSGQAGAKKQKTAPELEKVEIKSNLESEHERGGDGRQERLELEQSASGNPDDKKSTEKCSDASSVSGAMDFMEELLGDPIISTNCKSKTKNPDGIKGMKSAKGKGMGGGGEEQKTFWKCGNNSIKKGAK